MNRTLLFVLCVLAVGCARTTGESGVKPVGVGFDPGELFPGPEPRGGVIDYTLLQLKGTNLDLGVTGFFLSTGAFTDPENDLFESVLGFSYWFSPALIAADELSVISPKGPDIEDTCFIQLAGRGPLGSFRTVDVGDRMTLYSEPTEDDDRRSEYVMPRDPQNYPTNTTSVFLAYSQAMPLIQGSTSFPDNWSYGKDLSLHFAGGLPPEGTPVASIPRPSDAADELVGKEAGDPTIYSPDDLGLVMVSNQLDGADAVAMRYAPGSDLPDPRGNDGVIHVSWGEPTVDASVVTIALKLLGEHEGDRLDDGQTCLPYETVADADKDAEGAWLTGYTASKARWCDDEYEPDAALGNDEFGFDYIDGADTCHDGLDNNLDGSCDEGGCEDSDGNWLRPDPNCARHIYKTASCGSDGLCRHDGGGRGPDGQIGDLICTATDDGQFTLEAEAVNDLLAQVGAENVHGAMLSVSRITEELITVPMVRNQVGNQDNINPVRFRAAQVQFGRVTWNQE